jgi:DNA helicase MCM8
VATPGKINIRLHNHPDSLLALKSLKASCLGKLVSVRGTVVRMSVVKPLVKGMDFTCSKCKGVITRQFKSGRFSPPSSCSANCRSKTFTPERATAKLMDFQKIRLQEISNLDGHEEGRLPRTVE